MPFYTQKQPTNNQSYINRNLREISFVDPFTCCYTLIFVLKSKMSSKNQLEVSKMLKFLKKEEQFYEKTLSNMKKEILRLQVEQLSLKAKIRQEMLVVMDEKGGSMNDCDSLTEDQTSVSSVMSPKPSKKIPFDEATSSSSCSLQVDDHSQSSMSQPSPAANDSVMSNITDERYLEPLVLNPNYHDNVLGEFDD